MAITFSTPYEGASAVAAISTSTLIASFTDGEGRSRNFRPPVNPAGGTAASAIYPSITSVTQVLDSAGSATGPVLLVLAPGTSDTVNAASPMRYTLDQDVEVVTVSGTY
jgi:hypothetical protein